MKATLIIKDGIGHLPDNCKRLLYIRFSDFTLSVGARCFSDFTINIPDGELVEIEYEPYSAEDRSLHRQLPFDYIDSDIISSANQKIVLN